MQGKSLLAVLFFLTLMAAATWWFARRSGSAPKTPTVTHDLSARGGEPEQTEQTRRSRGSVATTPAHEDWQGRLAQWLFEPNSHAVSGALTQAIALGELTHDTAAAMLLDLLLGDVVTAEPRLCRDKLVAGHLLQNVRPAHAVVARALAYKRSPSMHLQHATLQLLLVNWPCFDEPSCRSSLVAALGTLPDQAVWQLLRERFQRGGTEALPEVIAAALDLARDARASTLRISLVMEAMFSFCPSGPVMTEVRAGMARLGVDLLPRDPGARAKLESFGVWGPSMVAWGVALRAFLHGLPSAQDSIPPASRQQLLSTLLAANWPGSPSESNAFHRMLLGLTDGNEDPDVMAYLRRAAMHGSPRGVRLTALAKLGARSSAASLEQLFGEMVAADASVIRDAELRIGFYAAVENALVVSPASLDHAARLFRECLVETSVEAVPYQRFVLEALERNPIHGLAWPVEQLMHHPGKSVLASQAARTLARLRQ